MKTRFSVLILLFALAISCNKRPDSEIVSVEIKEGILNPQQQHLSEIATKVNYVALETKEECQVGANDRFQLTSNYIVAFGDQCLLFNREGKFIRTIGKQGRGPKEYSAAQRGYVFNEKIYVPNQRNLQVYNLNGDYLKTVKDSMDYLWKIPIKNDLYFGYRSHVYKDQKWCFAVSSEEKGKIIEFPLKQFLTMENGIQAYDECIYAYHDDNLFLRELYSDTIFTLTEELKFAPKYKLNCGELQLPLCAKEGWSRENIKEKMEIYTHKNFRTTAMFSGKSNLFICFVYNHDYYIGFFSKKNGGKFMTTKEAIVNDLDGICDFSPTCENTDKYELAGKVWPYKLIEKASEIDKTNFEKLIGKPLSAIQETDNPIVMIAELK